SVAVAVIAGLVMTRLIKPLHLPDVTAYLLTGVAIGPYLLGSLGIEGLGFCSAENISALSAVSETALGFIAFAIGNEFRLGELKKTGKAATVIGILQAFAAAVVTDIALIAVHFAIPEKLSLSAAITLGAIATATAPAATLMVVRQYKAKGELTNLLLPIVALDDAVGLVIFAVSFGIAKALDSGIVDIYSVIIDPLLEIVLSLLLGAILGYVLTILERKFLSNSNRLSLTIGFVFLTVALSALKFEIGPVTVGFSSLLVCMMLGTVFCNTCPLSFDLMERADKWTAPLFIFFFVISGAELELSVFGEFTTMLIGIIYVLSRAAGKYFGAYAGCKITNQNKKVTQNLGIALFPQAGVALGMCVTASTLEGDGETIRNIVLFAIFVYEIFGPMLTKGALKRAGDIVGKSDMVKNRRTDILSGKHKTWNEEEQK
ncbi:MAG: cation:proton antiporter, partial [Oscillospiraceae bacterium]|nr:cation:proton antiporter [Oscillospiraceae bacterium]